ncbi:MAG: hypothetical protein ACE5KH_03320 [Candidatus Geothermarchaeales archaeon]
MTETEESSLGREKLPISESLRVIRSETLSKTEKWWLAIALLEAFGRKQLAIYLWLKKAEGWRRQQKFVIRSKKDWERMREAVGRFLDELP